MMRPDATDEDMSGLVDRLVCGELNEATRGRVLAWLEEDRARWRLCGLAFLEAQTWSQAFVEWPRVENGCVSAPVSARLSAPEPVLRRRSEMSRTLATVACAFALGLVLHDFVVLPRPPAEQPVAGQNPPVVRDLDSPKMTPPPVDEHEPLLASLDVRSGGRTGPTTPIRIPVVPARLEATQDGRPSAEIPDYVRQQWERRGYKVSLERRFLFARLPNGEQIVVPVEQLHVNPNPIHVN
jgi:hypothetical protein